MNIVEIQQDQKCETVTLFIYSMRFLNRLYRLIWCRDFTIICITKKLEVKMLAYTSFISDVHKSYGAEKIALHHLISLLIKISGSKRNFIPHAFAI